MDASDNALLIAEALAWAEAIVSNDADRIASFMADDWVMVSDTGLSTREAFLSLVRSGRLSHTAMDMVGDPRIRFYGDTAIVTSRITNTAHFGGQTFEADEWTTDVFVRVGDRWLCVLSQITTVAPA